jgi:Tfp pilus assembly protein PilF
LRAHLLERSGRDAEAIEGYRRAIALDEEAAAARNNLALLLAERGALEEAREHAQRAYALAGDDEPEVVDTLGWIYLRSGYLDRGTALIERAHRAAPTRPGPRLHLALAYREAGRTREARALLDGLPADSDLDPALRREAHAALATLRD